MKKGTFASVPKALSALLLDEFAHFCFYFGQFIIYLGLLFITWSLHYSADLAVWFSLGGVLSVCVTLSVKRELEGGILQLKHKQNKCNIRNQSRFSF